MRTEGRLHWLVLVGAVVASGGASAQSMGTMTGVVTDALTHKPLAEATVIARSPAMEGEQTVTTDDAGAFEMTLLPAGTYGLSVEHTGFQTFAPGGVVVKGHKNVRVKLALMPEVVAPRPPPPPAENVLEFNPETMTPPAMLSGPNVEYTPEAIERGVEGTMVIRCIVSVDGRVHGCKVVKGLPFMNGAVMGALESRRYKPATAAGKPAAVTYTFNIKLALPQ